MSTCSCCKLIVWNWSVNRSYIKDYKQNSFIYTPYPFTRKNPFISDFRNIAHKYVYLSKNSTDSLSYLIDEKTVYICAQLAIYILARYLTRPLFSSFDPDYSIIKAGGMIIYKNKVLIVQSNFNKWGFPKGTRNPGESVLECAAREIREETSLDVDLTESDRLLYSFNNTIMYYKKLNCKPKINISHIIREQKDCTGIAWIRLSCLKKQAHRKNSVPFTVLLQRLVSHYF